MEIIYPNRLEPGDIILTSSWRGIVPWFLNLFQRDKVNYGHVSMMATNYTIIEADYHIRRITFAQFFKKHKTFKIIRFNDLSVGDSLKLVQKVESKLGLKYGWLRFICQIFDNIFHTNWFTGSIKDDDIQICSSLVAWAYDVVLGIEFCGIPYESVEPDDIEDEVEEYPALWYVEEWRKGKLIQSI